MALSSFSGLDVLAIVWLLFQQQCMLDAVVLTGGCECCGCFGWAIPGMHGMLWLFLLL
jgi:hypothetical protein